MTWKNIFTDTLRLQYPIIQAPMLGVSTPEMAAAVSNAGGLGSLAVGGLSPDTTRKLIQKTKALTEKPFAVNLFVHEVPTYADAELNLMRQLIQKIADKRNYKLEPADLSNFTFYTYHDQLDILLEEKIRIVSFTFGCPDEKSVGALKKNGCILIGTATSLEEAIFLKEKNIDMIAVQGIEAGGHRGSFLNNDALPQVGLFSLLPTITKKIKLPCIAAGGINSGQTIKASFDLGAVAVQIGTAFIGTDESEAIPSYKERLANASDTATTLTRAFSGRWARGIRNKMMEDIEQSGIPIPPYPWQNSLTMKLRKLAQQHNDGDYTNMWAGQSAGEFYANKSKDVFLNLIRQYESL